MYALFKHGELLVAAGASAGSLLYRNRHACFCSPTTRARQRHMAHLDMLHYVERRAEDRGVGAEAEHARYRHVCARERRQHGVLPLDGVRRGQHLARRLLAEHVQPRAAAAARRGAQQVCGIALPVLELPHVQRCVARVARDSVAKVRLQAVLAQRHSTIKSAVMWCMYNQQRVRQRQELVMQQYCEQPV